MGFFLEKTWMWWLLTAVVAALLTWLLLRVVDRRAARDAVPTTAGADAASGAAPSSHASGAAGTRPVLTPSRGISLRGLVGGDPEVAALRAEIETLRRSADETADLRSELVTLRVDAARAAGLEEEVRLLRLRLEGEDGQVAVLKRRIALLEAEASKVPDLERELERAGRPRLNRTLGQVVQQAAGLSEDTLPPAPVSPAVGVSVGAAAAPAVAASASVAAPAAAPAPAAAAAPVVVAAEVPAERDVQTALALADAPDLDLQAARADIGVPVALDDLKLVEGVGPKIEQLLHADGIRTWRQLAQAAPERLRAVLDEAGPRFQLHSPETWPQQAELLASGRWKEFVELTGRLKGGRA